jgi:uracil-DNA glycosylase
VRLNTSVRCTAFPCGDVAHDGYLVPALTLDPDRVAVVLVSEGPPADPADGYYAQGDPLFARTTVLAFQDAGAEVSSMRDILDLGVYCTTAVKCPKTGPAVARATVAECSHLLERELTQFPRATAYLLMGDAAIGALNAIAKRWGEPRPIPAGSTYKIRGGDFRLRGIRLFPSYLQAGPAFFIEKSKRRMIAEDIAAALRAGARAGSRPRGGQPGG